MDCKLFKDLFRSFGLLQLHAIHNFESFIIPVLFVTDHTQLSVSNNYSHGNIVFISGNK